MGKRKQAAADLPPEAGDRASVEQVDPQLRQILAVEDLGQSAEEIDAAFDEVDAPGWNVEELRARAEEIRQQREARQSEENRPAAPPEPAATPRFANGQGDKLSTCWRDLYCALTETERAHLGARLGALVAEEEAVREQARAAAARYREEVKALHEQVEEVGADCKRGETIRRVECEVRAHFDTGVKQVIRLDTKEIVQEDILTAEERQQLLPGVAQ